MKVRNVCCAYLLIFALCFLTGCDAFVRKFTKKSKKTEAPQEEMVLEPQEYKPAPTTGEEVYRQYLLYWRSWQDELIESLLVNANHKKQVGCAIEALKNLEDLKKTLNAQAAKKMEAYIERLKDILSAIEKDAYGSNAAAQRAAAERLRRDILRDFSYAKIKADLL
jgi:hypothetical protein